MEGYFLTKDKKKELEIELEELKSVKRGEIAKSLEDAKALGDLSENAEYHQARSDQVKVEERIMKLEDMLKSASIVSKKKGDEVGIGSTVVIKKNAKDSEKREYTIVGSEESDLLTAKISYASPLGSAMMGKKKGENFTAETPSGTVEYKVVSVS